MNARLQTTNPKIFAAGDVCSRYKFTHAADAMAQIVIQNALFPHPFGLGYANVDALVMPWRTLTEPEIAHVGMYEQDAKEKGIEIETYTYKLDEVDRAILDGEDEGFARIHIEKGTDKILAATIVEAHAGDMIREFSVAMKAGAGAKTIAASIHPYPTQAEVNKQVVNPLAQSAFHTAYQGSADHIVCLDAAIKRRIIHNDVSPPHLKRIRHIAPSISSVVIGLASCTVVGMILGDPNRL